jgi:hypothetical protein
VGRQLRQFLKPVSNAGTDRSRVRYRISQFARQVVPRRMAPIDHALRAQLSDAEWALVERLTPGDRAHLLDVRRRLEVMGCGDADVLKAALLHDVGKVDDRGRVYLAHRVAVVLLRRWAPWALPVLARPNGRRWCHGLYLAVTHPGVGAEFARRAGCNSRVCWLIAHHHDASADGDAGLAMLRAVDGKG